MNEELYRKVREYRTAAAVIKEMLRGVPVDASEYRTICTVLAEKCGLNLSTIYFEIDLLYAD